jgi:uncharacterized protein with FMN-binding domain
MLPRRAVIALVATVLGLVLLLSFKTTPAPTFSGSAIGAVPAGAGAAVGSPPAASTPATGGGAGQGGAGTGGQASDPGAVATPTPTAPPAAGAKSSGTITGQAVDTPYGTVQVQITLTAGRISDIQAVQLPSDRRRSAMISQYVGPILRSEALSAQSAQIDLVSGATYTSQGYAQSLQSALDQAHG